MPWERIVHIALGMVGSLLEGILNRVKTFSHLHRMYIIAILSQIVQYYGDNLLGYAIFGSYARGDNRKNSDLDILIILKRTKGFSQRIKEFVDNIEMKHENLAQEIFEQEDILCELSPYILAREEALKLQPVYFDLIEHNLIIYDPEKIIARIIEATRQILIKSGAQKVRRNNTWEWQMGSIGFGGGIEL
ncbi:MAG: nucleotidyltransferase domain-containing protein [Bacillota bacterium]